MSGMPWIKLYSEFLDDPKLARLSDSIKLRFIQILLVAGECDAEGYLINGGCKMAIQDIAWRLRVSDEQMQLDAEALSKVGSLKFDEVLGAWLVPNFSERQGRSQEGKRAGWREHQEVFRLNLRNQLYEQSEGLCEYCGAAVDQGEYVIDHILPTNRGGKSNPENLCVACISCNTKKRDRTPEEMGWQNPRARILNVIDDNQNVIDDKQKVINTEKRREEKRRADGEAKQSRAPVDYPDDFDFTILMPAQYDRVPELKMFRRVTRRTPGSLQLSEIVQTIRREKLTEKDLVEPWRHWAVIRGYKQEALEWLTEWAPAYKRGEKPWERGPTNGRGQSPPSLKPPRVKNTVSAEEILKELQGAEPNLAR